MEALFLKILNMGIAAGWMVLAVIVVRFLLKKAPKWIMVLLWGLVGIRLVCPFSLESVFSLIPSAETVPDNILHTNTPTIHSGIGVVNAVVNPIFSSSLAPNAGDRVNPMQMITLLASMIWIAGMAAMLLYAAVSFLRIKKKVREAAPSGGNIWVCDHVDTPFLLGILRPRIYLPSGMDGQDRKYVLAHEQAHLSRGDHWWKPLGFLLLAVYWFHPLCWIAYILLCRDMELACDEKVIRRLGTESKKPYSNALINCSLPRRGIAACPVAFGEISIKERVKSVLHYKKPGFWILAVAAVACIAVAVCFLTNPKSPSQNPDPPAPEELRYLTERYPAYFGVDASNGLDIYVCQFSAGTYYFGLLPHTEVPREPFSTEMMELPPARASEMRQILATYQVDEKDIHIIPWQHPLSSFIGDIWFVSEEESIEERQHEYQEYIAFIHAMLFGE